MPLLVARAQAAELYHLDPANTRVSFEVRLFGLPWVTARFDDLSGELMSDRTAGAGRVDVTVRTASLRCGEPRWDARLMSSEWLDAPLYPQITYHSDHVRFTGHGGAIVSGRLTLHGRTRPVVLTVDHWDCDESRAAQDACSFEARGRTRRSEYGLPHGFRDGGDEVEIVIGVSAPGQAAGNS
ncbi:MAG TPA: YceI family protein [Steroidobacteraceae bacterium]